MDNKINYFERIGRWETGLRIQKDDLEETCENVAIINGLTTGIITGLATFIFTCYHVLRALPNIEGFIFRQLAQAAPAIAAIVAGYFATTIPVCLFHCYNVRQIDKMLQKLSNYNSLGAKISLKDLKKLIKVSNCDLRKEILTGALFEELFIAREVMGAKEFHSINDKLTGQANQLWELVEYSGNKDEAYYEDLKSKMKDSPFFAQAVYRFNPKAKFQYEEGTDFIPLVIGGVKYPKVSTKLLQDNFEIFKNGNTERRDQILAEANPKLFGKMIDFVKDPSKLYTNHQRLIELIPLLILFKANEILERIDSLFSSVTNLSLQQKIDLFDTHPGYFIKMRQGIICHRLNLDHFANNESRLAKTYSVAKKINSPELHEKCQSTIKTEIIARALPIGLNHHFNIDSSAKDIKFFMDGWEFCLNKWHAIAKPILLDLLTPDCFEVKCIQQHMQGKRYPQLQTLISEICESTCSK